MRFALLPSLLCACALPAEGLRETPAGDGPMVRVDFDAEPLPDIPFPNDLATRPDPTSPTGLRLNLPPDAPTRIERSARQGLNQMSGFGIYAPISLGFEEPLDIAELLRRHPDDLHVAGHLDDDAIFLIDVDPDSPGFLSFHELDLGQGRFPGQLTRLGRLFSNDPHDGTSLIFDTVNEDLDGDGLLDPGEDTDGDGVLDVANVMPGSAGDPFYDLLTGYEVQTHSLIVRPVLPLREQTTYAVVLTERVTGTDGAPIRSPWGWVNHTRQTPALLPALDALADLGLTVNDVAFAWVFTTGDVTGELHEVVQGLYDGEGPFRRLHTDYPAAVTHAAQLHTLEGIPSTFLPTDKLIGPLEDLGLLPSESFFFLSSAYGTFTEGLVGGTIRSPYLLVDKDGDGSDADEAWLTNRQTGYVEAEAQEIAFTCAIPRATADVQPAPTGSPWPISIHGHGLGSTRIEFIAFAWALNRQGIASCGIDAPGHGLPLTEVEQALAAAFLDATGTEPLWWHLLDARYRDLDNDGQVDGAADQFTADLFHTRDMLRQPVVDWAQLMRAIEACGTGEMEVMLPTKESNVPTGRTLPTCDWDGDGTVDLGGPGTRWFYDGVSMGGIEGSLATAVLPNIEAAVLTVPGAGLFDVGSRTDMGSVLDGLAGRALTPLLVGIPQEDGSLQIVQEVISWDENRQVPVASLPGLPAGSVIRVTNLAKGLSNQQEVPPDGRFRVPIKADAAEPAEKALLAGIPPEGAGELDVYTVEGNEGLGDPLLIEVFDALGRRVLQLDTFGLDARFDGVTYPAGSPLVAASWGLGLHRSSPDLRRIIGVLSMGIEPADPIAYARQWADEPVRGNSREVLIALTVGDSSVPQASGISLARAAGIVRFDEVDPRYGTSVDGFLKEKWVIQSQEEYGPYRDGSGNPVLYDPDDLDEGIDPFGEPTDAAPLRLSRPTEEGVHGLRFIYTDPRGAHAYFLPDEFADFDANAFAAQQLAWFLATEGREISDDPCMATRDCPFMRPMEPPQ